MFFKCLLDSVLLLQNQNATVFYVFPIPSFFLCSRSMAKKKRNARNRSVLYVSLGIITLLVLAAGIKIYEDVFAGNINLEKGEKGYVYVYSTRSFGENMELITQSGILNNGAAFNRLARLTGYNELIRPGRYEVKRGMSNLEILRMLVSGRQTPVDVVFKSAQRKQDLVRFFATQLEVDSSELLGMLNNPAFCDSLGLTPENILVLFIPNTYNYYWNTTAGKLMDRTIKEYRKFWNEERVQKLRELNLSHAEVSILAAIVQKETYRKDEMPVVAGVYINRLRRGMPLQADPTIIYAMNDNSIKRVAGSMLEVESPYNTYKYRGLTPGPICVPATQAIDAVLNYTRHNYIYFCAKEDFSGYHNFAATFAQHQVNARKYQRELNRRGVK